MEEQFVQDAICHPARLQRVLHDLGYSDWTFVEGKDLVNQEFNFSAKDEVGSRLGGRIDVIATFNGGTRLVVIEVKATASEHDLNQLNWYLKYCGEIKTAEQASSKPQFKDVDFPQTVGILLAHTFVPGTYNCDEKVHLVQLKFDGANFPFCKPTLTPPPENASAPSPVYKHSRLYDLNYHRSCLKDGKLEAAFDELCNLCLPSDDPRLSWGVKNYKSGHVAIHYKGTYVLYLFVGSTSFDFGYENPKGENVRYRLEAGKDAANEEHLERAREEFPKVMQKYDLLDGQRGIPADFDWARCLAK